MYGVGRRKLIFVDMKHESIVVVYDSCQAILPRRSPSRNEGRSCCPVRYLPEWGASLTVRSPSEALYIAFSYSSIIFGSLSTIII